MAEGLLRHFGDNAFASYSAGTEKTFVRPLAIEAMQKIGIDISKQKSKTIEKFIDQEFDYVITLCDSAAKNCPFFPGARQVLHWDIPDPSQVQGSKHKQLAAYITVRDMLQDRIKKDLL